MLKKSKLNLNYNNIELQQPTLKLFQHQQRKRVKKDKHLESPEFLRLLRKNETLNCNLMHVNTNNSGLNY